MDTYQVDFFKELNDLLIKHNVNINAKRLKFDFNPIDQLLESIDIDTRDGLSAAIDRILENTM